MAMQKHLSYLTSCFLFLFCCNTRFHVNDKVYNMIIDVGSCTNVASISSIEKLGLAILKHLRPYKL